MKILRVPMNATLRKITCAVLGGTLLVTGWAADPAPPRPLFDAGSPAAAENFKALFDARRAQLSEPINKANEAGIGKRWFPAPPNDWLASNVMSYGFNVEGYPTIAKSSAPAFELPAPPLTTGTGAGGTETKVFYLKNEDEARQFVQSSTGVDLGFSIGTFSLGLDFQSSHMSQSASSSTKAWFVVTYSDIQSFEYGPESSDFSDDAKTAWEDPHGLTKFYGRYGTHFISAVKTGASLKVIFTLNAATRSELDGFAQETGISATIPKFDLGLKDRVSTAIEHYASSVSLTSEVSANGAASFGLPQSVALDFTALKQLSADYIAKLGSDRSGLAATAFQIRPYRELFGTLGTLGEIAVADAVTALGDMTASEADIRAFIRWPGFYPSRADIKTANDVRKRHIALINSLDALLKQATPSNIEATDDLAIGWLTHVHTIDWPTFTNRVLINFDGFTSNATPPTVLKPLITIPKVGGYTLQSLTVTKESMVATGNPATLAPSSTLTLGQSSAPTPAPAPSPAPTPNGQVMVYHFEPISLADIDGKQVYLEATDSLRHTYRYMIVLRVGGLRNDLATSPEPMVTTH